jgi:hypothetical protein
LENLCFYYLSLFGNQKAYFDVAGNPGGFCFRGINGLNFFDCALLKQ